ncbi:MAG: DEAD/DEAH box helicase [Candidatus Dependentiae bacterium]|nr:DEAD/DEAH box helicase [Candidatus Dependentiae bacterium]
MTDFTQFNGLSPQLLESLTQMGFVTPTPIQVKAIPLALEGKDILGSAQTGTGKTGAFAIPLVSKILNNEIHSALVLTPTRELAVQVLAAIQQILGKKSTINTALLIGGEAMPHQYRQLRRSPRIVVGTPGRINDHLERQTLQIDKTTFLVLDETDRMLDMGFGRQIDSIVEFLPTPIQTLMFSATMPRNIMQMAAKYLKNPERIEIGSSLMPVSTITQESIRIQDAEKYGQLIKELDTREGSVVIFVKTKQNAKNIADRLYRDNFEAEAIHGNLRQNKRDSVIKGFRESKFRVLVATDVAARGLDVPHIQHVINHDLPQCPEDYIHRIGRTARAGAKGSAINFITNKEDKLWRAIERFMKTGDQPQQNHRSRDDNYGAGRSNSGGSRFGSRGSDDRRSDDRRSGGRSSFGGRSGGRSFGGERSSEGRSEGRSSFGGERSYEGRSSYAPRAEGGSSEGRSSEGRSSYGAPRSEGRSEGRSSYGAPRSENRSEGRSEGRRFEGGSDENRSSGEFRRSSKPRAAGVSTYGSAFNKDKSSSFSGGKSPKGRSNASSSFSSGKRNFSEGSTSGRNNA